MNAGTQLRQKPTVQMPGGAHAISATGRELGRLLADRQTHFMRGGNVVRVRDGGVLHPVRPVELASDFEEVAFLAKANGKGELPRVTCTEGEAKLLMSSKAFRDALPPLNVISRSPVMIERGGELVVVCGYDRESGILAHGVPPQEMTLGEARTKLRGLMADFRFASPSDRSRAFAAMITPALVLGCLLDGRAPIDLGEADKSQSGKGYRTKVTTAIYGHEPKAVTNKKFGGLEESFDAALVRGTPFIAIENVRGRMDSEAIESFMTEPTYTARFAFHPPTDIDPRRFIVSMTSNKAEMVHEDLPNRCSCVRILKQPDNYQFRRFPEGDLHAHVVANCEAYLGAVFAVVKAWYEEGKKRTDETRHNFRDWAQSLDWVVQNLLGEAPLMDGHKETQRRMSNPAMTFARDVALAVARESHLREPLTATAVLSIIEADGTIDIPGGGDLVNESVRKSALQQIGRKLGNAFHGVEESTIIVDRMEIKRESEKDRNGRVCHRYRFDEIVDVESEAISIDQAEVRPLWEAEDRQLRSRLPEFQSPGAVRAAA